MNKNNYMDDFLVVDEELVDINTKPDQGGGKKRYSKGSKDGGKKKKIIIICSVAAAVAVGLGVTAFCLFGNKIAPDIVKPDFVFSDGTTVSGISIAGKTMDEAQSILLSKKNDFITPVNITVDSDGKLTKLTQDDFEYTFNIDTVLDDIKRDQTADSDSTGETKSYEIKATATESSIETNVSTIAKDTDVEAQNAKVSKFTPYDDKNRFEYAEAIEGLKLDRQDLTAQLKDVVWSGAPNSEIEAKVEKTQAEIQIDDVKKNIVKLSTYKTVSYNTANGTSNMRVSLAACNGSVIEPGAIWSFNDCTGNSNLESNGYKSAGVIENGKHAEGIGGGICQSSSTIYNAAIRANMTVEERHNHQWASSYVPTGLDATIDYGNLDLKLSNPTDYQMFLECKVVDTTLYVSFWGYKSPSYDEIKTHNEMVEKSSKSYTVKAWRVYFKDGEETQRESLGSSTYDTENGYYFIEADNDSGSTKDETPTEKPTSKPESSQKPESSHSQGSQTSKPEKPTSAPKPTQKPTKPATEPATEPQSSAEESETSNPDIFEADE